MRGEFKAGKKVNARIECELDESETALENEDVQHVKGHLRLIYDSITSGNPVWARRALKRAVKIAKVNFDAKMLVVQSQMFEYLLKVPDKLPALRIVMALTENSDERVCKVLVDVLPLVFEHVPVMRNDCDKVSVQILIQFLRASAEMRAYLFCSPVFGAIRKMCQQQHKLAVFQFLSTFTSNLVTMAIHDADKNGIVVGQCPAWVNKSVLATLVSGHGRTVSVDSDLWYCLVFFCSANDSVAISNGLQTMAVLAEDPSMAATIINRTNLFESFRQMWLRNNDNLRGSSMALIAQIGYSIGEKANDLFIRTGVLTTIIGFCKEMGAQGALGNPMPLTALKCLSMYLPFNTNIIGRDIDGPFIEALLSHFSGYEFAACEEILWLVMNIAIVRPDAIQPLFHSSDWMGTLIDYLQSSGSHISQVIITALDSIFTYETATSPTSKELFIAQNGPEVVSEILSTFDLPGFRRAKQFLSHFAS